MQNLKKDTIVKNGIFLVLMIMNVGIEFAYRWPLYKLSISLQEQLQDHITDAGVFTFKAFSFWGNGLPYFTVFILMLNWQSLPRPFYYLFLLLTNLFINNTTRMAIHQPRPYVYSDLITPYGCSLDYGNPSGHSLFAASFNTFIYLDLFHTKYPNGIRFSKIIQFICLFISLSLTFLVGFARFYVGVHSMNQILYGWLWGFWIAFYFHICLREPIQRHIRSLIVDGNSLINVVPFSKYYIFSTLGFTIVFFTQIVTYIIVDFTFVPEQIWVQRIADKCGVDIQETNIFNDKTVINSGVPTALYGCYLGLLLRRRLFGPIKSGSLKTTWWKYILRLFIFVGLALPFGIVYLVIPSSSDIGVLITFKVLVPFSCIGLIAFAFSHIVFEKLNLVNHYPHQSNFDSINEEQLVSELSEQP